jgi:hypothetical protein
VVVVRRSRRVMYMYAVEEGGREPEARLVVEWRFIGRAIFDKCIVHFFDF